MTDDASSQQDKATRAMVDAFKRWMEAPSFAAGLSHLAGRRARMEATCAHMLTLTPADFARVMNEISPGQYLKRPMTVEAAVIALTRYRGMAAREAASELADLVETAQLWSPHRRNAATYFDALYQVEVKGHRADSGTENEDPLVRKAQQARRWLGQPKRRGRPRNG